MKKAFMTDSKKRSGFTLIELLVVIAIIGILAAMVLVALGSARNKAKDARITGAVSSFRSAAEMYNSDNSAYGVTDGAGAATSICTVAAGATTDTYGLRNLYQDLTTQAGGAPTCVVGTLSGTAFTPMSGSNKSANAWVIYSKMATWSSTNNLYACSDSTGQSYSKVLTAAQVTNIGAATSGTACP